MKTLLIFSVLSASVWGLTLDEAQMRAVENSPQLFKAKADGRYAQSAVEEARSAFEPYLTAGYRWQHVNKTTAFSFSPSYEYSLTAGYSLFNGMSDLRTLDAKKLDAASKELLAKSVHADVRLQAVVDYIASLKAVKTVGTQTEALASLTRQYNDIAIRFEQGMVAKNEMLQVDVERLQAEQALFAAKSELTRSRAKLRQTLGGVLQVQERIEDVDTDVADPQPFDLLLQKSFAERSELKALYKSRDALLFQRRALDGDYYPDIDLEAEYVIHDQERMRGTSLVQQRDELKTTLTLNWDLYGGGITEAQQKGILEQVHMVDADIKAMKLQLRYQLEAALETFHVAQNAKRVAQRAKESAEENYRIVSDRFSVGRVDTLTLLRARSDLTNALNSYNNAYYDLFAAYAAVERIAGE